MVREERVFSRIINHFRAMKRTTRSGATHSKEFKGVVKKITGKLTNDPPLEKEGREEMLGLRGKRKGSAPSRSVKARRLDPDPHRRG